MPGVAGGPAYMSHLEKLVMNAEASASMASRKFK
jgi:hypothetical protein